MTDKERAEAARARARRALEKDLLLLSRANDRGRPLTAAEMALHQRLSDEAHGAHAQWRELRRPRWKRWLINGLLDLLGE